MTKSSSLIKDIGAGQIKAALGVTDGSIRKARIAGIPALWFGAIEIMCLERGIACPRDAFNFKGVQ